MRTSKKEFLRISFALALGFGFMLAQDEAPEKQLPKAKIKASVAPATRLPATAPAPKRSDPAPRPSYVGRGFERAPAEYAVEATPDVDLGKNFSLVQNLAVLPLEAWDATKGELVQRDRHFAFFKPVDGVEAHPVAFDKVTSSFHPVSHILHIRKATPEVRQELLAQGLKEYYFNSRLKFLSLESTPTKVVELYRHLRGQGFEVNLEVLRDAVVTK